APAVALGIALQALDHPGQALAVRLPQQATPERWEAEAEDHPDVHVGGIAQDPFFHAAGGLVEHLEPAALDDLLVRHLPRLPFQEAVDRGIDLPGALLLFPALVVIEVEAALRLAAQAAVVDHAAEGRRRLEPVAERLVD